MPFSQSRMFANKTRWRFNLEKQTKDENVTEVFAKQKQLVSFVMFFSYAQCSSYTLPLEPQVNHLMLKSLQ